VENVLSG